MPSARLATREDVYDRHRPAFVAILWEPGARPSLDYIYERYNKPNPHGDPDRGLGLPLAARLAGASKTQWFCGACGEGFPLCKDGTRGRRCFEYHLEHGCPSKERPHDPHGAWVASECARLRAAAAATATATAAATTAATAAAAAAAATMAAAAVAAAAPPPPPLPPPAAVSSLLSASSAAALTAALAPSMDRFVGRNTDRPDTVVVPAAPLVLSSPPIELPPRIPHHQPPLPMARPMACGYLPSGGLPRIPVAKRMRGDSQMDPQ